MNNNHNIVANHYMKSWNDLPNHEIAQYLSINERIIMHTNFETKTKPSLSEKDQNTIRELIDNTLYYFFEGSFNTIDQQREYRNNTILSIIEKDSYIISKVSFWTSINDWKYFIKEICDLLFKNNIRDKISISNFFNIPIIEEKDFLIPNDYYYKWIGINILFMRQMVCENFKYFDEYLDHFSPDYNTALWYAHWSRTYYKPGNKWYILCINKEKLSQHLNNNIHHIETSFSWIQIDDNDKKNYHLYHTIIPINCVDKIIEIAPKKL